MTTVEIDAITALSARHVTGKTVEDDGELAYWIEDGGPQAVEISHEIGDPEESAQALIRLADGLREHAERIRSRHRTRTAGWT
jgi:hypothetical protein